MSIIQAFPAGGGSAEYPAGGTKGQALVKNSNADNDVKWEDISGEGHTIQDNSGTDLPQRENLKIVGASVTDDSENNSTIITIDLDSKADKVQNATSNNLAGLDASGNLKDSGIAPTDISGKENKFRYTTMPTASASNLGQVVQYLGTTTQVAPIYTQGYFYKCIYEDDVYKWVESKTQDNVATEMIGATTTADGKSGSVPKPFIDDRNKALFGDGHYHEIYSASQGSTVIVKADTSASSVKGQTCTLSDGRTSLTQTVDSETGEAVFTNVTLFGGVTAEATNGQGDIARGVGNITYFGQYIVSLSMNYAVVNITTTDSALYGQNISVFKDGSQVASVAFNILGQANIALGVIGEYVFKIEANNKFAKATVNVLSLSATYSATLTLTTLFAVHYSERNSDPNSCTYPAGYSNSNFTDPFYVNLSNGTPHWGDWSCDQAKFLIPKSCMLKGDGTVDYYLNENNNKKKTNGASSANGTLSYDGNAMMEWAQEGKRIYWTIIPDADEQGWTWVVGDGDYDGLLKPWNHIAYDGSINHHFYLPKYAASYIYNSKARSMSGYTPTGSNTYPTNVAYARANNKTSVVIWDGTPLVDWFFLTMMCVLFSKSLNAQAKFGRGWVDGVAGSSSDVAKVSGGMDTKGLFYGSSSTSSTTLGVKIFGTENPYGNMNKMVPGLINDRGVIKIKMCYGRADGSTVDDYNTDGTGYVEQLDTTGTLTNTSYLKNMQASSMCLVPKNNTNGSSSTYYCDSIGYRTGMLAVGVYGGAWVSGDETGCFCFGLSAAITDTRPRVGVGLSCKPLGDMR